jgi:hypothetical protein
MSGPLSTNAPFSNFGQAMILRDIEQLYLLIGNQNGDMGNAGYSTKKDGDLGKNAVANAATSTATAAPTALLAVNSNISGFTSINATPATISVAINTVNTLGASIIGGAISVPTSGLYFITANVQGTHASGATVPYFSISLSIAVNGSVINQNTNCIYTASWTANGFNILGNSYPYMTLPVTTSHLVSLSAGDLVSIKVDSSPFSAIGWQVSSYGAGDAIQIIKIG